MALKLDKTVNISNLISIASIVAALIVGGNSIINGLKHDISELRDFQKEMGWRTNILWQNWEREMYDKKTSGDPVESLNQAPVYVPVISRPTKHFLNESREFFGPDRTVHDKALDEAIRVPPTPGPLYVK
jgi:hypothetical protein